MTSPSDEIPAALEVYYDGEQKAVSRGGNVLRLIVPFEDMPLWRAIVGEWSPDNPVSVVVARVAKPSKRFDPKLKEWIVPDDAP